MVTHKKMFAVREITLSSKPTYEENIQNSNISWNPVQSNNDRATPNGDQWRAETWLAFPTGKGLHGCHYFNLQKISDRATPAVNVTLHQKSIVTTPWRIQPRTGQLHTHRDRLGFFDEHLSRCILVDIYMLNWNHPRRKPPKSLPTPIFLNLFFNAEWIKMENKFSL